MNIIEQIKTEIERLKTVQLKRIQEGDLVDAEPYDKNEAYNELLDFLDTLESEKPMNQEGLEEEINRYLHEECSDDDEPGIHEIAEHFVEWGYLRAAEKYNEIEYNRQRAEESVPNDLEEAAWGYASKECEKAAFIAGAKWQAEQFLKSSPLPEDTVLFNKGVAEGKRLMMEEAVEYEVWDFSSSLEAYPHVNIPLDNKQYHSGDKVRIIIVKEGGE